MIGSGLLVCILSDYLVTASIARAFCNAESAVKFAWNGSSCWHWESLSPQKNWSLIAVSKYAPKLQGFIKAMQFGDEFDGRFALTLALFENFKPLLFQSSWGENVQ